MISFDKHTPGWHKNGCYHKGVAITITIYPGLIIPSILEQLKKGLKYRSAIALKAPQWNGSNWQEWDEGTELENLPF